MFSCTHSLGKIALLFIIKCIHRRYTPFHLKGYAISGNLKDLLAFFRLLNTHIKPVRMPFTSLQPYSKKKLPLANLHGSFSLYFHHLMGLLMCVHTDKHKQVDRKVHTLYGKQFQESRCTPIASCGHVPTIFITHAHAHTHTHALNYTCVMKPTWHRSHIHSLITVITDRSQYNCMQLI